MKGTTALYRHTEDHLDTPDMEVQQESHWHRRTKKKQKMSSLKQFEYAEIIVEPGVPEEGKSDSELKTFLLSLLSYDLEQQILKRLTLTL